MDMFSVGDYALHTRSGRAVQIIEVKTLWGIMTCKVYDALSNTVLSVSADDLSETGSLAASEDSFVRFIAASRMSWPTASCSMSANPSSRCPIPHCAIHLKPAQAQRFPSHHLIADSNR